MLHAGLVAFEPLIEITVGSAVTVGKIIRAVKDKLSLCTMSITNGALVTVKYFTGVRPPLSKRWLVLSGGAKRLHGPHSTSAGTAILPNLGGALALKNDDDFLVKCFFRFQGAAGRISPTTMPVTPSMP